MDKCQSTTIFRVDPPPPKKKKNPQNQKRVLSPKAAFRNGSDWLVIGRPITKGNIKNNIKKLIDHLN